MKLDTKRIIFRELQYDQWFGNLMLQLFSLLVTMVRIDNTKLAGEWIPILILKCNEIPLELFTIIASLLSRI